MPGTLLSDSCIASEITRQLSYILGEPPRPLVTFLTFWNSGIVTSSRINLHFPQCTYLRVPRRELQKKWNPRMTRIRPKKTFTRFSRVPFFRMRPIPAGMMYALTRLGSGKARCFSSKSSRSCVGSPKTKRPDGSSARQKRTGEMGVQYEQLIFVGSLYLLSDISERFQESRRLARYPWHAHSFRTQPDLDSFQ